MTKKARKGRAKTGKGKPSKARKQASLMRRIMRRFAWAAACVAATLVVWVLAYRVIDPPGGIYMLSERIRLGHIEHRSTDLSEMSWHMPLAAMAAEDAKFCDHLGFDMNAIQDALIANEAGKRLRGGSTISQQVAKNVFLWQERSWLRKGLEAGMTVLIETLWPKRRIVEVYLNIAEFDEGVFGASAAAEHYFGKSALDLSETEAARLAAILPAPKTRSASRPGSFTRRRARSIIGGMRTLATDGRAACLGVS